jgi:rhomboid protease GluP
MERHQDIPDLLAAQPMHPAAAPATYVLIGANVAVFLLALANGAGLWHSTNAVQLAWGASFGPATKSGEWWRLATAMFLHFGLVHLALNSWALWDCGRLVERLYGSWRLAVLYLASGLAGNLLSLISHGDRAVSGGASGAIFGLYGALLAFLWLERRRVGRFEFRWLFGGALAFCAAIIGLGVLIPGIDNAAHAGGLAAGALLGAALVRPAAPPGRWPMRWLAAGAFVAGVTAMILALPAPSYRWRDELRARAELQEFARDEQLIMERWREILEAAEGGEATFEQLAERVEADVAAPYERSFAELSSMQLAPAAPTARSLEVARRYAQLRTDAWHLLADGLRAHDEERIREALELARQAPYVARGISPPPP